MLQKHMPQKPESPHTPTVHFSLNPNLIAGGLAATAVFLGIAYSIICYFLMRMPEHPLYALPRFFDLGDEGNLPSYFSALCLLAAGILSLLVSLADTARQKLGWRGLGLGFCFLSFDEAAQIHDGIINPVVHSAFGSFGVSAFYYGWVVAALCGIVVLAVLYIGFLSRLPRNYAIMFIISGFIYIGGAVGMEMVESHFMATGLWPSGWFPWRMLAEEMSEMMGVILFVFLLLRYMARLGCSWNIAAARPKPETRFRTP